MVNELKPCPFCGGAAAIHWRAGNAFASCEDLGCVGSDFSVDPTAWNTRADTGRLSELEAEVARLREALAELGTYGFECVAGPLTNCKVWIDAMGADNGH